jgi:hypothetical protein
MGKKKKENSKPDKEDIEHCINNTAQQLGLHY